MCQVVWEEAGGTATIHTGPTEGAENLRDLKAAGEDQEWVQERQQRKGNKRPPQYLEREHRSF